MQQDLEEDQRVIQTAEDALASKLAAVDAGYYKDPYLRHFGSPPSPKMQVIIKRGTFARVACVSTIIRQFLAKFMSEERVQIVILGAGKDTTFFRLMDSDLNEFSGPRPEAIRWVEVDHPHLVHKKVKIIETKQRELGVEVGTIPAGGVLSASPRNIEFYSSEYHLLPYDLRKGWDPLSNAMQAIGVEFDVPTLFLSECVFMYMPTEQTQSLLSGLSNAFSRAAICMYEPILGSDPFGKVMETNLKRARVLIPSSGLSETRTLEAQQEKLSKAGFATTVGLDMKTVYETLLTKDQLTHAARCEMLDELEEFHLIMRHYCLVFGVNSTDSDLKAMISSLEKP